ncbi:S1C family serine protease [Sporosarcina highlanderae]|uniref:Serine protease n=1 Tax=Sporosarcina highlanderae TaxID=3035916 RepID=A0ABT8JRD5_9BACL|nr:serine protease [Sporosarcina highlanderae]MDN4607730.1 serine protease [Sporosarcina highlanderae]
MTKKEDIIDYHETDEQFEQMSEEEINELVLEAQQEALLKSSEDVPSPKKRIPKWFIWLMAITLALSTFVGLFQMFSIPAIDFLLTSAKLSQQKNIAAYKKSVVVVSTESGKGTGFSISENGTIVTNYHVIENDSYITVVFPEDGRYNATVLEAYPEIDLAVLEINGNDLPSLSVAKDVVMEENDPITFIGNPLSFKGIANQGIILTPILLKNWTEEVSIIKAPVYRGNSGSPVINDDGEVIGVVFATLDHQVHGKVGLFIPIDLFHKYRRNQ